MIGQSSLTKLNTLKDRPRWDTVVTTYPKGVRELWLLQNTTQPIGSKLPQTAIFNAIGRIPSTPSAGLLLSDAASKRAGSGIATPALIEESGSAERKQVIKPTKKIL
jgi:hypothetical protein